ncbi:hypothetical protein CI109_104498 [Kwoniella shandongensis]|uniref:Uncharacterized protein n=1 Tax=Kwoniella shandongensis TaxID=1734106 RepID=A0A5M6BRU9_9TREE|nr:uncharacterized protein CI109_006801 [Kwoniella shandongensis]KAA5524851.1 hypothetical protein CI109_006801 [Kwoniella shandongensis]
MSSCQTCSSDLPPSAFKRAFITPCCSSPICETCINRNPRLREYIPCLRCGDPRSDEQLRGGSSRVDIQPSRDSNRDRTRSGGGDIVGREGGEVVFEIGEDEDDLPPTYDEVPPTMDDSEHDDDEQSQFKEGDGPRNDRDFASADVEVNEDEMEVVEVRHTLQRGETLLTIARKYAADPHDLLTLNSLPPSTLSTHPRLLQTRKTLLISRRSVPKSKLLNEQAKFSTNEKVDVDLNPEQERLKAVKRFQLLTKSTDPSIGKTYLGLEEMREEQDPFAEGSGEALSLSSDGGVGGGTGKKMVLPEKANREDRALDRFWQDEEWEEEVGGPDVIRKKNGKWKVVGSGSAFGLGVDVKS